SSPEELISEVNDIGTQIYVNSADRDEFRERVHRDGAARMDYEALRKDGSKVWLSVSARAVSDANGNLEYFESIAEDITEQVITENALRESRERLDAALKASETGTFRWNFLTDEVECDPSLQQLLGLKKDCQSGLEEFASVVEPEDRGDFIQNLRQASQNPLKE